MNSNDITIANAIIENIAGSDGPFSVDVDVNGITVVVEGCYEAEGYMECYDFVPDAWVTTYSRLKIYSIEAYNEDSEVIVIDCDPSAIERYVENGLAA